MSPRRCLKLRLTRQPRRRSRPRSGAGVRRLRRLVVARNLRRGAELLRLHLHFARNPAAVASVLRAQGPLWAVTALQRFQPGHRTHEPALELLTALAASPEALPALVGPTRQAWPASSRGAQRLSAALAAARCAAAESAGADSPLRVVRVHCGGRGASSRARLTELNDNDALLQQLRARCDADADGKQPPPIGDTVRLRPVPADDPRTGLAGVGTAAYAVRDLQAYTVIGPYSAWVTTPDEFDECVAVRERAEYEAHAVTTETPLELKGIGSTPLMFVAHPPSVADATCELNDWRVAPADKEREQPGDGPNCELVRARPLCCSCAAFDRLPFAPG